MGRSVGWLVGRMVGKLYGEGLVHFNWAVRYLKPWVISEFANASVLVSKLGSG